MKKSDCISSPLALLQGRRYQEEKPWSCTFCYWWKGRKQGCGLEQCHYLIPEKIQTDKPTGTCADCPYGAVHPCIGYCIAKLYEEIKKGKGSG